MARKKKSDAAPLFDIKTTTAPCVSAIRDKVDQWRTADYPGMFLTATQEAVTLFWDYVAFLLNSLVFLLVGLDVPWSEVRSRLPGIMVAALIALLARALAVYAVLGLLHPLPWRVSLRWQHLVVWSGLRGAIAVALALSLTETNPQFNSIRALVYGVVLLSILLQGSTIGPLARLLLRESGEAPKPA